VGILPARANRGPTLGAIVGLEPDSSARSSFGETFLRSRRTTRITFAARDPDDDALTFAVDGLPAGATFDKAQGVLTWRPTRDEEGKHELTVEVTDGHLTARRTFRFFVGANRAPVDSGEFIILRTARPRSRSGAKPLSLAELDDGAVTPLAQDPDADPLTVEVRKQPAGAWVVPSRGGVRLVWEPTDADAGEHDLVVDVSHGELRTTIRKQVVVVPE